MPHAYVPDFHTVPASSSKTLLRLLAFRPPWLFGSNGPAPTGLRPEPKSFAYAGVDVVWLGPGEGCACWFEPPPEFELPGVDGVVEGVLGAGVEGCDEGGG